MVINVSHELGREGTLDDSYASAARQLAQSASDPNGAAPSKQALAAAARASRAQASALRP